MRTVCHSIFRSGTVEYLLLLSLLISPAIADTNLLTNPGFEDGTSDWLARSSSISAVSSPVHDGSGSVRIFNRNATWQGIQQDMLSKMVIGQTYTISGWMRLENAASDTVIVSIQKADADGTHYTNIDRATATNSGWVHLSGDYTLTANGALTQLYVYFEGPAAGVNFYVDDAAVNAPNITPGQAAGVIDVTHRHQVIEGLGAAGAWYEGWLTVHPQRETLYDLFFDDLGLDIYRLRNTYDQGSSGDDFMSRSAQIVAEAKERNPNLKILLSSWSPPGYLKSNGQINGGDQATLIGGPTQYDYAGFADWWADSISAWAGLGVHIDYISIQNEPDYDASWDSCRFDPTENAAVAGYDRAFEAVYNAMISRFGSAMPKMLGPESTGFYGASGHNLSEYVSHIDDHDHVYGYSHHLYNIGSGDDPDAYLSAMQTFNAAWGDKPLFQTEYEKSTSGWPDAFNMALLLHNALTVEEASGYLYWSLFWEEPSGLVGFPSYGSSNYTIYSDFYGFKHFSAFTDPGWQRVEAEIDNPNLRISAYINPDNTRLSVMLINTHSISPIETELSFSGFAVGSGQIYRTTAAENCVNAGDFDHSGFLTMPPQSIVTLSLTAERVYGDMNADQVVNILDLPDFLKFWLEDNCLLTDGMDLNGDCRVDWFEFSALAENWH